MSHLKASLKTGFVMQGYPTMRAMEKELGFKLTPTVVVPQNRDNLVVDHVTKIPRLGSS